MTDGGEIYSGNLSGEYRFPKAPPKKLTFGEAIMIAVEKARVLDTCIFDSNGDAHINWKKGASQRIEESLKKAVAGLLIMAANNDSNIDDCIRVLAESHKLRVEPREAMRRCVGTFVFRMFKIELPKLREPKPTLTIVPKDGDGAH
jgi:hypothetical protein